MRVRCRWLLWSLLLLWTSALALEPSSGVTVTPLAKETTSWDGSPILYPELTDAFVNDRSLSPALWTRTSQILLPRDYVDLISLVSQYVLFALTNVSLQVQLEPPVAELPGIAHQ